MKKIVILLALFGLFYSTCLGAEYAIDKGANMFSIIGGYVNASGDLYDNSKGESSNNFLVMPSIVHFSPANVGFGGDLLYLRFSQGDAASTILGLGPKMMFTFGGKESKTYPYLSVSLYYVRNTESRGKYDYTVSGTRLKFGAGTSIMVAPHLGILMEASYNLDNLKPEHSKNSIQGNMIIVSVGLAGFTF